MKSNVLGCVVATGALLSGCASSFPPAVPVQPLPSVAGLTILLAPDSNYRDSHPDLEVESFAEGVAQGLSAAGFKVVRAQGIGRGLQVFDLAIAYGRSKQAGGTGSPVGVWHLELSEQGNEFVDNAERYAYATRYRATHPGRDVGLLGHLDSCFAEWKAATVYEGKAGTIALGTDTYELDVNGPLPDDARPDTNARAASFMVHKLLACPGLVDLAQAVEESGVGAAAAMEKLPTGALLAACKGSDQDFPRVPSDGRGDMTPVVQGTGRVKTMDDACTIALERDPGLAPVVHQVRATRAANKAEYWASGAPERAEQARLEGIEERKQERADKAAAQEQRDQREEQLRQQHDAAMAQLPGVVSQAVTQTQAAIAPVVPAPVPQARPAARNVASATSPASRPIASAPPTTPVPGAKPAPAPGPAPAPPAPTSKQAALAQCLAQPITPMRTIETNPFMAFVQEYQGLLAAAQGECAAPGKWRECMGMNARLWPDEAAANYFRDMQRRAVAATSSTPPGSSGCLDESVHPGQPRVLRVDGPGPVRHAPPERHRRYESAFAFLPRVWAERRHATTTAPASGATTTVGRASGRERGPRGRPTLSRAARSGTTRRPTGGW